MQHDNSSVHQTEVNRIQTAEEGGWEFVCHSCGYRARYTVDKLGTQKLEILFVGDASARHTSGQADDTSDYPQEIPASYEALEEREMWLTGAAMTAGEVDDLPGHIIAQVEAILSRFE